MALPTQPLAAGVVIGDGAGHVLMVLTHGRRDLVLPGGLVEAGESPAAAAVREVHEEVGLDVAVTRLLAVAHTGATDDHPAGLYLAFDTAPFDHRPELRLQPEEIGEAVWVPVNEAVARHVPRGRAMLAAALAVRDGGSAGAGAGAYLDDRIGRLG